MVILVQLAAVALILSTVSCLTGIIFHQQKLKSAGRLTLFTALLLLLIGYSVFWAQLGRPPIYGTYESTLMISIAAIFAYFLLSRNASKRDLFGLITAIFALFAVGYGAFSDKTPALLGPAFKSKWLWFHIGFAWLAFSSFFLAAVLAGINLIKSKNISELKDDAKNFDELSFKLIIFGFISHSIEIAAGSFWANDLYGAYWGWDPVETWSLIVWIIYAVYLHLRITLGWQGKKISLLAIFSPIAVIISYGGVVFLNGVHGPLF